MARKLLTREQYRQVKRMDHRQMEDFITKRCAEAYQAGKKSAGERAGLLDLEAAIQGIKGIGKKKAAEVMATISRLYGEG